MDVTGMGTKDFARTYWPDDQGLEDIEGPERIGILRGLHLAFHSRMVLRRNPFGDVYLKCPLNVHYMTEIIF
jgi:hypothetical protein